MFYFMICVLQTQIVVVFTAFSKAVQVMGHEYHVSLVDTAGQDEYTIFPPEYSANIHGYVLVYSIDSSKSYEVCKILHEKLIDLMGGNNKQVAN